MKRITYGREFDNQLVMEALSGYSSFGNRLQGISYADELVEKTSKKGREVVIGMSVPEGYSGRRPRLRIQRLQTDVDYIERALKAFERGRTDTVPALRDYLSSMGKSHRETAGAHKYDFRLLCEELMIGDVYQMDDKARSMFADIFRSLFKDKVEVSSHDLGDEMLLGTVHVHVLGGGISATDKYGYIGVPTYVARYFSNVNKSLIQGYDNNDVYDLGEITHNPRIRRIESQLKSPHIRKDGEYIIIEDDIGLKFIAVGFIQEDKVSIDLAAVPEPKARVSVRADPGIAVLAFNEIGNHAFYTDSAVESA